MPYWSVYLKTVGGFTPVQIGQLISVFMLSKIVAPLVWGWLTDYSGQRLRMIQLASALTVVTYLGVYQASSFSSMLVVMASFGFFWNAVLPQFEALTLSSLGAQSERYSRIRLWGSVGFIMMALSVPPVIDKLGFMAMLHICLALFVGLFLTTLVVKEPAVKNQTAHSSSLLSVLKQTPVWIMLVACFVQQASHGPYYTFFSIYLEEHAYPGEIIGAMWSLGVVSEVIVFMVMVRLIQRFGAARLFILAMLLTALRWFMLGAGVAYLGVLLPAQVLHAASYGLFHAAAIHLIHSYFPGRLQGRGQALYAAIGMGAGGAAGSLLSGYSWTWLGDAMSFYVAAFIVLSTIIPVILFVQPRRIKRLPLT